MPQLVTVLQQPDADLRVEKLGRFWAISKNANGSKLWFSPSRGWVQDERRSRSYIARYRSEETARGVIRSIEV